MAVKVMVLKVVVLKTVVKVVAVKGVMAYNSRSHVVPVTVVVLHPLGRMPVLTAHAPSPYPARVATTFSCYL